MDEKTKIALANYDYIIRTHGLDNVGLEWNTGTLLYGEGGGDIDSLCEAGFTPATASDSLLMKTIRQP